VAITNITAAASPERQDPKAAERAQLAHLAQEFEAMFISEMMRGMRESLLAENSDSGLGSETMTDTFDSEFGRSMSNAGGLGLAQMMLEALKRREGDAPTAAAAALSTSSAPAIVPASAAPSIATPRAVASVVASRGDASTAYAVARRIITTPTSVRTSPVVTATSEESGEGQDSSADVASGSRSRHGSSATLPGPVTSRFGWRADPFTGRAQFHAGTDIRLAYGHEVQAVAPGRVASVGERSGYGLTVVIDHGRGLETRYAHLSQASVKAGDVVDSGQVVARSGNSGRSTGPHLHLEARQNGRAVEMASLLKSSGMSADSYADDRSSVRSSHED